MWAKHRVALRGEQITPLGEYSWASNLKLVLQVLPFKCQLAGADRDFFDIPDGADLGAIEGVAPMHCLRMNCSQVRVYGGTGLRVRAETFKLWMMSVAACFSPEHGFCQ